MKWINIATLTAATIFIFGCYSYSEKATRKNAIYAALRRLLLCTGAGMGSYALALTMTLPFFSYLFYSVYNIFIIAMGMALVSFVREYTGIRALIKGDLRFIGIAASIDCLILLINPFVHWIFKLRKTIDVFGYSFYAVYRREPLYVFHFGVVFLLLLMAVIILARKWIGSPKIYKLKYASILLSMFVVMAGHLLYLHMHFPFNYSILFYAAIAVLVFYFSVFYIPRGLMEKLLYFTIANMKDGIVCMDVDGSIAHSNNAAAEFCGGGELAESIENWFKIHPTAKDNDEVTWKESRVIGGQKRYFTNNYKRIYDDRGKYLGCFFIYHDRTDEYKRLAEEKYRSSHDSLTDLYNNEHFCSKTEKMLEKAEDGEYLIFCTDVKNFKLINEIFSLEGGDSLLKEMAKRLEDIAGDSGICGRLAGDRFAVCMPKEKFSEEALLALNEELGTFFENDGFKVHMHFGVIDVTDRSLRVSVMCDRAILAIKPIKDSYHRVISYYKSQLHDSFITEQKIISQFEDALRSGQFVAFIQPQITVDGQIRGGEALVRWYHPVKGYVSPAHFIGVFEQTGLISRLDRYMWELACRELKKWRDVGMGDRYISVNISKKDFFIMDVADVLISLVGLYGIDPRCLHLEITETAVMDDPEKQTAIIARLRSFGFVVEIDDFGSGYSSLNTLKDLNVDVLKVDMGFLTKTDNPERSMTILKMIITLAKSLNMEVITEGVETQEQVEFLTEYGCDIFQGYYFARPMQVSDFEAKYLNA